MKILLKLFSVFFQVRKLFFKSVSNCKLVKGCPNDIQPILLLGKGCVEFGSNVMVGYNPSPFFYNSYAHIEARSPDSVIKIGKDTVINNEFVAIANNAMINIGEGVLIGSRVTIINSDFHNISPAERKGRKNNPISRDVVIGDHVFLGASSSIMKGVTIGDGAVIGYGSVVTKDVPSNTCWAGNPAKQIKKFL